MARVRRAELCGVMCEPTSVRPIRTTLCTVTTCSGHIDRRGERCSERYADNPAGVIKLMAGKVGILGVPAITKMWLFWQNWPQILQCRIELRPNRPESGTARRKLIEVIANSPSNGNRRPGEVALNHAPNPDSNKNTSIDIDRPDHGKLATSDWHVLIYCIGQMMAASMMAARSLRQHGRFRRKSFGRFCMFPRLSVMHKRCVRRAKFRMDGITGCLSGGGRNDGGCSACAVHG